jgi:hypothetical protein
MAPCFGNQCPQQLTADPSPPIRWRHDQGPNLGLLALQGELPVGNCPPSDLHHQPHKSPYLHLPQAPVRVRLHHVEGLIGVTAALQICGVRRAQPAHHRPQRPSLLLLHRTA